MDCLALSDTSHLPVVADVIADGAERWSALSEGKTSDQLVDVLLEEIGAGLLRERDTFVALVWLCWLLHPLGLSPDCSSFCREGQEESWSPPLQGAWPHSQQPGDPFLPSLVLKCDKGREAVPA